MYLIFVVCVWIVLGLIFVDWRSWRTYYPTIQYYIIANLLYEFLYYDHTLWAYKAITTVYLNHTAISLVFFFLIVPITLFIYLQHFPQHTLYHIDDIRFAFHDPVKPVLAPCIA